MLVVIIWYLVLTCKEFHHLYYQHNVDKHTILKMSLGKGWLTHACNTLNIVVLN